MFLAIIGGLLIAWFLNLFGFYQNIFCEFVQPLVNFEVTIGFYYGSFVVLALIFCLVSSILNPQ